MFGKFELKMYDFKCKRDINDMSCKDVFYDSANKIFIVEMKMVTIVVKKKECLLIYLTVTITLICHVTLLDKYDWLC